MSSEVDETYGIKGLRCKVCDASTYFGRDGLCPEHLGERPDAAPPPSDAAPVAWRYKHGFHEDGRTLWLYTESDPALLGDHDTQPLYAHPEDAPPWISPYFRRQLKRVLVLIRRNVLPADLPNAEARLREAIRFLDTDYPEDAPGGPWEGLARMMYDSLTCQHRACFFCGRTVGHEEDCQWRALNRLKGETDG